MKLNQDILTKKSEALISLEVLTFKMKYLYLFHLAKFRCELGLYTCIHTLQEIKGSVPLTANY